MLPWVFRKNVRNRQSAKFFPHSQPSCNPLSLGNLIGFVFCGPPGFSWVGGFWSTSSSFLCQMINWMKFNIHNWIGICSRSTRAFRIRLTLARSILKTIVVVYSCWSLLLLLLLSCLWLTEGAGGAKGFKARDFIFNRQTSGGNVCPKKGNFY